MKYFVHGFYQPELIKLGLDNDDALILRYLVDFISTGLMETVIFEDHEYYWINYQHLINDLPILHGTSERTVSRRFEKMIKTGILHKYVKTTQTGRKVFFRVELSQNLISQQTKMSDAQQTKMSDAQQTKMSDYPNTRDSNTSDPIYNMSKFSNDAIEITKTLIETIKYNVPETKTPDENDPGFSKWVWEIDKLIRIDKQTLGDINIVIKYIRGHSFWSSVILSSSGFRRNFVKILAQIPAKNPNVNGINDVSDYLRRQGFVDGN